MTSKSEIVVGLDIGTTKICAMVGEWHGQGQLDIIGMGTHPSRGLRKGVVVHIDATVESIKQAVHEAELMSGREIKRVYAGIAGGHIQAFNSRGTVQLKEQEVSATDLKRVIAAAQAIDLPAGREIIHILPQEYIIDAQEGIKAPLGMHGMQLEARVHIVTGAVASAQNIIKCAMQAGLHVDDIVLEPLASSEAVLTADEKKLGVALIDIGGGTTDLAIWKDGMLMHTSVLPLGGEHLTHDIAIGLRTPLDQAEHIKQHYGTALLDPNVQGTTFQAESVGNRPKQNVEQKYLVDIIQPRVEEIFSLVHQEIVRTQSETLLASGAVITGGSTLLDNMPNLAEKILGVRVRHGIPQGVGGLAEVVANPMYATGVGLVQYGCAHENRNRFQVREKNIYNKVIRRMRSWLGEIF